MFDKAKKKQLEKDGAAYHKQCMADKAINVGVAILKNRKKWWPEEKYKAFARGWSRAAAKSIGVSDA